MSHSRYAMSLPTVRFSSSSMVDGKARPVHNYEHLIREVDTCPASSSDTY